MPLLSRYEIGGFQNEFAASVSASPSAVSVMVCLAASLERLRLAVLPDLGLLARRDGGREDVPTRRGP